MWISREQFAYWSRTHTPTGSRFLIRFRIFTDDETAQLALEPQR